MNIIISKSNGMIHLRLPWENVHLTKEQAQELARTLEELARQLGDDEARKVDM